MTFTTQADIRQYQNYQPRISKNTYIDPSATVIGQVELAPHCSIWPQVVIRGDVNYIKIGRESNIQDGSVLHVSRPSPQYPNGFPLLIGEQVTVGHKAMLHGCTIGNRVLISMGTIILDGAIIEDEIIIGAGSVIPPNKHLLSGYLYLGNPIRQVRQLSDAEKSSLTLSANNYVRLKDEYQLNQ